MSKELLDKSKSKPFLRFFLLEKRSVIFLLAEDNMSYLYIDIEGGEPHRAIVSSKPFVDTIIVENGQDWANFEVGRKHFLEMTNFTIEKIFSEHYDSWLNMIEDIKNVSDNNHGYTVDKFLSLGSKKETVPKKVGA